MKLLAAIVAGLVAALLPASAGWAHGAEAPPATNYRTEVRAAPAGVTMRVTDGGYRLELTNHGPEPVEVLGYEGEPFLRITPEGAYENEHSPTPDVNETGRTPPATDPTAAPAWRQISDQPVARWHDHRATRPAGAAPPGAVQERHVVGQWRVPLRVGGTPAEITGTVEWWPPPGPGTWWAVILLGTAVVATLGRLGPRRVVPAVALIGAGAGAVAYAVARQLDTGATGVGDVLLGLATGETWAVLAGLAAIAAGGYAGRRGSEAADFTLALAGTCVAIFGGLAHAVVLTRAVAPVPGDPAWARGVVSLVIAGGAGVAVAAVLRLRAIRHRERPGQPTAEATLNP